jgi:hypothetical protein
MQKNPIAFRERMKEEEKEEEGKAEKKNGGRGKRA